MAKGRQGIGPDKLLEVEGTFQGDHLIIFDGEDAVELFVDGESVDCDEERVVKIVGALGSWLERRRAARKQS